jgi:predicted outer membrane repeat protein
MVFILVGTALLLTFPFPQAAAAATPIYVRLDGDDVLCNGTADQPASAAPDCAKQSIQAGVDVVDSNGDVYIASGTYVENVSIDKDVHISGAGKQVTVIDGNALDSVIQIVASYNVYLSDVTIQNGDSLQGGGAAVYGNLFLSDCEVLNNTATTGGGIYASGELLVDRCRVAGNTATETSGHGGGGIYVSSDSSIIDTTIFNNHADNGTVDGGGVYANLVGDAMLTLQRVTIEGNTAAGGGAGVKIQGTGSIYMANVTIADNTSAGSPGGLSIAGPSTATTVNNSVVVDNHIGSGSAGGIIAYDTVIFANTIVAHNDGSQCFNGAMIWVSNGYNIDSGTSCGFSSLFDQSNTDPLLGSLQDNGGHVDTMALLSGSPAIDTGDGATCYNWPVDGVDARGVARPIGTFCDIGAYERNAPIFSDVAWDYWARDYIEGIYHAGITSGCGGGAYCPTLAVSRAQMAKFLLVSEHGSGYIPPAGTGTMFGDVPPGHLFVDWIEQLANEGITSGCGGGNYCPDLPVSRAQMAKFLLIAEHGSGYTPPAGTGTMFLDVGPGHLFVDWIEQLANEGVTSGCGGGNYCPDYSVARDQMAVFLVRTFDLQIP